MIILQILIILLIFPIISYIVYRWVNQKNYPKWLDYQPFNCGICCTFWSLLTAYISIGFAFGLYITLIGGCILAVLNAIAMKINQKNKTVLLEDIE